MNKKQIQELAFNEARRAIKVSNVATPSAVTASANRLITLSNLLRPTVSRNQISSTGSVDHTIATINVADEQAGLIWVMCFGVNTAGNTYAAIKQAQFKNTGGTLTIGTITDTMTEEITATGSTLV